MTMMSITGIGPVAINHAEYVSPTVLSAYTRLMAGIKEIYDKRADNPQYANLPPSSLITAADYDSIMLSLKGLSDLAKNGTIDNTGPNQLVGLITADMAGQIDNILRTLQIIGISPFSTTPLTAEEKVQALQAWQNLAGIGVEDILQRALNLSGDIQQVYDPKQNKIIDVPYTRTLQSMVELDYVKQANEIIFGNLNQLEEALGTTQGILNTLTIIQSISNQIRAPIPTPFDMPGDKEGIEDAGNAHFTQQIPIPVPTSTSGYDLLAAKRTLSAQLAILRQQAGNVNNSNTTTLNQNSLANSIVSVLKDISAAFLNVNTNDPIAVKSAVTRWIMDSQNILIDTQGSQGDAGKIQEHIQQAVVNGSILNDTQRENVRRTLSLFEEFYKSANSMLGQLTRTLEKLSENVGKLKKRG